MPLLPCHRSAAERIVLPLLTSLMTSGYEIYSIKYWTDKQILGNIHRVFRSMNFGNPLRKDPWASGMPPSNASTFLWNCSRGPWPPTTSIKLAVLLLAYGAQDHLSERRVRSNCRRTAGARRWTASRLSSSSVGTRRVLTRASRRRRGTGPRSRR